MSNYELTKIEDGDASLAAVEDALPQSTRFSSSKKAAQDIVWSQVNFSVPGPDGKSDKTILSDCWGEVKAGQVCAILGPSGAGKSSLLNVLAGRSAPAAGIDISSNVTVGGKAINPVQFRKNIAYVMQDDSLMATATPREALIFSARLRLDPSVSDDEIEKLADGMLAKLGLTECADVMIGGAMIKGISGGQRKRTSVGVEAITDPALLFLDEPTSGLDSFSAMNMVSLLKSMAGEQTAVLCTIHQPASEVFALFDKVIFMKEGRVFYQGSVDGALAHFSNFKMPVPANTNPADHIMYLSQKLTALETTEKGMWMTCPSDAVYAIANADPKKASPGENAEFEPTVAAGAMQQLATVFSREFKSIIRDKPALAGRFGITIFLNILYGLIFKDVGRQDTSDAINFSNLYGAVAMVSISSMFGSAQPVMLQFPFERPMFMREYSTGTYSAWVYATVKTLLDMPLGLLQTLTQYAIVFPLLGLNGNFFFEVLASWLLGAGAASCGMLVGCAVTDVKTVSEFAPVVFVPQLLFAGFFIASSRIPVFLRWAQYLCGLKYSMNLILLTEFGPESESCTNNPGAAINCLRALDSNDIEEDLTWFYYAMLLSIFVGFRLIAMVVLVQKSKRFY